MMLYVDKSLDSMGLDLSSMVDCLDPTKVKGTGGQGMWLIW